MAISPRKRLETLRALAAGNAAVKPSNAPMNSNQSARERLERLRELKAQSGGARLTPGQSMTNEQLVDQISQIHRGSGEGINADDIYAANVANMNPGQRFTRGAMIAPRNIVRGVEQKARQIAPGVSERERSLQGDIDYSAREDAPLLATPCDRDWETLAA